MCGDRICNGTETCERVIKIVECVKDVVMESAIVVKIVQLVLRIVEPVKYVAMEHVTQILEKIVIHARTIAECVKDVVMEYAIMEKIVKRAHKIVGFVLQPKYVVMEYATEQRHVIRVIEIAIVLQLKCVVTEYAMAQNHVKTVFTTVGCVKKR